MTRRLATFVFAIFAIGGLALTYLLDGFSILEARSAKDWVEVPCTIVHSAVEGDAYASQVELEFEYEFDGVAYRSTRYQFANFGTEDYYRHEKTVKALPPGTSTQCFVDPNRPANAVYSRDITPRMFWLALPGGIAVVGVIGLLVLVMFRPKGTNP